MNTMEDSVFTPEFPDGRYCYFSTLNQSSDVPSYPYTAKTLQFK